MMNTYRRPPLVFVRGKGCYLYDQHGRKYLDFLGGIAVNALGHAHPRLVRVMRREAARPMHVSNLFQMRTRDRWRAGWPNGRAWTACFSATAAPKPSKAR